MTYTHSVVLSLFMVNLEVTIVSTSLVDITNDLRGFDRTSWIVTGYLLTFTGMKKKLTDLGYRALVLKTLSSIYDHLG